MNNTIPSLTPTHLSKNGHAAHWETLFCGLAVADLLMQHALQRAEKHGLDHQNSLPGLFIDQAQARRMVNKPFGTAVWANGENGTDKGAALHQARQSWQRQAACYAHHPLPTLLKRFNLSATEAEILFIALLPAFDPDYGRLFAFLQDDLTRKRPSVNLILDLLAENIAHKFELYPLFLPNGRLARHRLLQIGSDNHQSSGSFLDQPVQPATAVVQVLWGDNQLDAARQQSASLKWCEPKPLTRINPTLEAEIRQACREKAPLLTFIGAYGSGKAEAAQAVAAQTTGWLLTANLHTVAQDAPNWPELLARLLRDGRLHATTLYLKQWETILQDSLLPEPIWQQLQSYPHPIVAGSSQTWQPRHHLNGRTIHFIHFPPANFATRLATWRRLCRQDNAAIDAEHLANLFQFSVGQIEDVYATARNLAQQENAPLQQKHSIRAARLHSNQRLSQLATQITPSHSWEELILPEDALTQLQELVRRTLYKPTVFKQWAFAQKLSYGKGVAALFVGESGTGKTLAADIIAGELGLELYKIDLSALVSKYIGETEKNLERVFTEASTSNAILFFDEADAIFGKRSEINDSHDRYANLEVSYLLQRMERFEGIVILASNLQTNIDDAFTRRLDFIIEFPFPQKAERVCIWQISLPPTLPVASDVDLTLLAERFELAGGNIRNAVLAAAFLAAADGSIVQMRHLLHAVRREYQKLGRLIDESLFRLTTSEGQKNDS